jgi:proteasome alpha subunit
LAEYSAIAIGKGKKDVMGFFEKNYKEGLTLEDAVKLGVKGVEKGLGEKEKIDINRLDFAFVDSAKRFERLSRQKLKSVLGKNNSK